MSEKLAQTELPNFNEQGLLPVGVYGCEPEKFRDHFVAAFPQGNGNRETICKGFFQFRSDAETQDICGLHWINGSYVTNKPEPNDIDVVTFSDYDNLESLNDKAKSFVLDVINGREKSEVNYMTHAFLVPCCGEDHPYYNYFEDSRNYWRKWFGKTRNGERKGFIKMSLGPSGPTPLINESYV